MARCSCVLTGTGVIEGSITGLAPGQHGIHVHIFGDFSQGLTSAGGIFNPFGKNHGAPDADERMTGDLGNLEVKEDAVALRRAPRAALLLLACASAFHAPRRAPRRAVALRSKKSERRWPFAFPNASDAAEGARDALASTRNAFDEVRARGDRGADGIADLAEAVLPDLARPPPDASANDTAADASEVVAYLSRSEQALSGAAETNPLRSSRDMFSVAAGAAAGFASEESEARANQTEIRALANALLRDGYFDESTGVSSLFPASAGVARVDATTGWFDRATFASELASAAYANDGARAAFRALGVSKVASGSGDNFELVRRIVCARERRIPASPDALPRDWAAYEASEDVAGPALDGVVAHAGFLFMAERLLDDLAPLLDVAEGHRVVLAGHSIGGALATLLTVLLAKRDDDRFLFDGGNLEAFTFAALPCLRVVDGDVGLVVLRRTVSSPETSFKLFRGEPAEAKTTLGALGLRDALVSAFVQPWDPLVRWYSDGDPCYPLIADMGDDGVTILPGGPACVLRPLARAVFRQADEWPRFRSVYVAEANASFAPTGDQYLIMPDETRYLADRIFSLIVDAFPLEEFSISLVPAALRSFVHHFHPAYSGPLRALRNRGAEPRDAAPTAAAALHPAGST
ncbi:lipase [Aureococcus anophagefferens]|nr:lipase [Aureococcus anophagefferens]